MTAQTPAPRRRSALLGFTLAEFFLLLVVVLAVAAKAVSDECSVRQDVVAADTGDKDAAGQISRELGVSSLPEAWTVIRRQRDEHRQLQADLKAARARLVEMESRQRVRGGQDAPACWFDDRGDPQYLLNITIFDDTVQVSPTWPAVRQEDPVWSDLLRGLPVGEMTRLNFQAAFRQIYEESLTQRCRHKVNITLRARSVENERSNRRMVEAYFLIRERN